MDDPLPSDGLAYDEDGLPALIISCAIDDVALAALRHRQPEEVRCNACDESIEGEPAGKGTFLWTRGDQVQHEESPLCSRCATAIGMSAMRHWQFEDDEG
jgi:hypothetical protein